MSNTINVNFEPDELAGLYLLANLALISVEMDAQIQSVDIKNKTKEGQLDYREALLDYRETVERMRKLPEGKGAIPAINKLDYIRNVIEETYKSMYPDKSETSDGSAE